MGRPSYSLSSVARAVAVVPVSIRPSSLRSGQASQQSRASPPPWYWIQLSREETLIHRFNLAWARGRAASCRYECSNRPSDAFIKERERARSEFLVSGAESLETKSGCLNKIVNLSVKMATAADPFPDRRDPILPEHHIRIGRTPMLRKQQLALRLENSANLEQSRRCVRYRTQCKSHHDGIKAPIFERQILAGGFHQTHRESNI